MARRKPRPTPNLLFPKRRAAQAAPAPAGRGRDPRGPSRAEAERLCIAGLAVESRGSLVLTPRGRRELAARLHARASPRPAWDAASRTLSWGGKVAKQLHREASGQEVILAAFEAAGWPERIDNPLPEDRADEPKQRLRDTVKNLQRGIAPRTIRFRTDGRGRGVRWEAVV